MAKLNVFGEARRPAGVGRARVIALKRGDLLPEQDPMELRRWQSLARHAGVRLARVPGGLVRTN